MTVGGGRGRQSAPPSSSLGDHQATESMRGTFLDNGVHVLSERIEGLRSATVGVWVRQGAAHESTEHTGVSHLLEHLVFKGTERRTAAEIATALESLGGSLDAYTTREHTAYQARVLDEHLDLALDVVADLVRNPLLRQSDLDLEREVVLEEIAQVEDTPDDQVFEIHAEGLWKGHPYGSSILGSKESVASLSADTLRTLHAARYRGCNLVVAAAGNVHHEDFTSRVADLFGSDPESETADAIAAPPVTRVGSRSVERESAQTHVVFGADGPGYADGDRYPLILLSSALGGGMSSRLFQRVREELGLCYSVFSYQSFYSQAGVTGVYVGTRPATAEAAVAAVNAELEKVAREGLPVAEVEQTKQQVKGQIMLSLESTGSRLHRLASFALHDKPFMGLDGLLKQIDAVSADDVARVAERYFAPEKQFVVRLGPEVTA